MAIRSRVLVVGCVVLGSGLGSGAMMVGCSGDDTTVPIDGSVDSQPDNSVVDVVVPDVKDSGPPDSVFIDNYVYDASAIQNFMTAQVANMCARYAQCCFGSDASAFDTTKCKDTVKNGVDFNLRPLLESPAVVTGGRLKLDQTAATTCLAEALTFSCPSAQATESSKFALDCYTAVQGTVPNGQPCNQNIECANGYCVANADAGDAGSGLCTALKGSGQGPCGLRNEECQSRGYLGTAARCDVKAADGGTGSFTCGARIANGASCSYNWECTSGLCDFASGKCQASAVTVTPGICTFWTLPQDAGGGG